MARKKPTPKTQREISESTKTPYLTSRGNPNDSAYDPKNRGNQTSFKGDVTKPFTLGLEDIDNAVSHYIKNTIKPIISHNGNLVNVPLIYDAAERWKQMQKDGYYRDKDGKIMLPIIVFKRTGIQNKNNITSKIDANSPNNYFIFTKQYSKKDAYSAFDLLNNRVPRKEYHMVVVPDYVTVTYDFIVSTYKMHQLNKIIENINYASNSYWGDPNSFKFKVLIDNFATPIEMETSGERVAKSTFSLRLHGYIIPDNIQKQVNSIRKINSKSKVTFSTEIVSSIDDLNKKRDIYNIGDNTSPISFE